MLIKKCHKNNSSGIALIEALVSIVIFTTGVLGIVGLQASMMRAQGAAKHRSDAVILASEVIGSMWSDPANLSEYKTNCTHTPCAQWVSKVQASLPMGQAAISSSTPGFIQIVLTWSVSDSGNHNYTITTAIR